LLFFAVFKDLPMPPDILRCLIPLTIGFPFLTIGGCPYFFSDGGFGLGFDPGWLSVLDVPDLITPFVIGFPFLTIFPSH
jgi:hypothetical protein